MSNQKAVDYTVLCFHMLFLGGLFNNVLADVLAGDALMGWGRVALSL